MWWCRWGKTLKKYKSWPRAPPSVLQEQRAYRKLSQLRLVRLVLKDPLPGGCALSQLPINPFLQPTFFLFLPADSWFYSSNPGFCLFCFGREEGTVGGVSVSQFSCAIQLSHQLGKTLRATLFPRQSEETLPPFIQMRGQAGFWSFTVLEKRKMVATLSLCGQCVKEEMGEGLPFYLFTCLDTGFHTS